MGRAASFKSSGAATKNQYGPERRIYAVAHTWERGYAVRHRHTCVPVLLCMYHVDVWMAGSRSRSRPAPGCVNVTMIFFCRWWLCIGRNWYFEFLESARYWLFCVEGFLFNVLHFFLIVKLKWSSMNKIFSRLTRVGENKIVLCPTLNNEWLHMMVINQN